jgi:hypothetical protein
VRAAGYRGPDIFTPPIVNTIAKSSGGLTRRINLIADKALLAAFSENTHTVRTKHVKEAVRDSEFSHYESRMPRLRLGFAVLLFVVGAGLGMALYALFMNYVADVHMPREPVAPAAVPIPPKAEPAGAASPSVVNEPQSPPPSGASTDTNVPAAAVVAEAPKADAEPEKAQVATDRPTAGTNSQAAPEPKDEIEQRLAATKEWLAKPDRNPYSIQLLGADNPAQLKHHLNVIRKYIEINDIFVYRTLAKQKPSLTVLYGSFEDRRAAQEALAKLPANLKAYKPVLRTMQGIRAEIAQHQSS